MSSLGRYWQIDQDIIEFEYTTSKQLNLRKQLARCQRQYRNKGSRVTAKTGCCRILISLLWKAWAGRRRQAEYVGPFLVISRMIRLVLVISFFLVISHDSSCSSSAQIFSSRSAERRIRGRAQAESGALVGHGG